MPRLPLLAAAIAAAIAGNARADEITELDHVVVSASTSRIPDSAAALPNTITIIDQQQLKQQLALTQDISQVRAIRRISGSGKARLAIQASAAASRGTTSSAVRPEGNFSATTSIQSGRDVGARFW